MFSTQFYLTSTMKQAWYSSLMIAMCCLHLLIPQTTMAKKKGKKRDQSKKSRLQVTHQDQYTWLNLYQSHRQTLQIWHQKRESNSIIEIASPAGGCRMQLYLNHQHVPKLDSTQQVNDSAARKILKELPKSIASPFLRTKSFMRFSLEVQGTLHLSQILSSACPLNQSKIKHSRKIKEKRYKVKADPYNAFRRKTFKKLQRQFPNLTMSQIWNVVPVASDKNDVWFYDDEFLIYIKAEHSIKPQIKSLEALAQKSAMPNIPIQQVTWKAASDQNLRFTIYVINTSQALTPLTHLFKSEFKAELPSQFWLDLLRFLSYKEGIYAGLSSGLTQNTQAALSGIALLMPFMSNEWLQVAVREALLNSQTLPNSYKSSIKPMDPRFFLSSILSYYLLDHPYGKTQAVSFLKTVHAQRLLGSYATQSLRSLWRYATHFAHRSAQKYLFQVEHVSDILLPLSLNPWHQSTKKRVIDSPYNHMSSVESSLLTIYNKKYEKEIQKKTQNYLENVVLSTNALYQSYRLMRSTELAAFLGATPAVSKRAFDLAKAWQKARSFFMRKLDINEARRRVEMWGNYLGIKDFYDAFQYLTHDLTFPMKDLSSNQISATVAADLVWGRAIKELEIKTFMILMLNFPAGLLRESGIMEQHNFIFQDNLKSAPTPRPFINQQAWHQVLWLRGIRTQLKKHWKAKISLQLEQHHNVLWKRLHALHEQVSHLFAKNETTSSLSMIQLDAQKILRKEVSSHPWTLLNTSILTLQKPQKILRKTIPVQELR
jgi:hypothetical protein